MEVSPVSYLTITRILLSVIIADVKNLESRGVDGFNLLAYRYK